jgi:hypothetical protein
LRILTMGKQRGRSFLGGESDYGLLARATVKQGVRERC